MCTWKTSNVQPKCQGPLQLLSPSFSHDLHHETDTAKRKGGGKPGNPGLTPADSKGNRPVKTGATLSISILTDSVAAVSTGRLPLMLFVAVSWSQTRITRLVLLVTTDLRLTCYRRWYMVYKWYSFIREHVWANNTEEHRVRITNTCSYTPDQHNADTNSNMKHCKTVSKGKIRHLPCHPPDFLLGLYWSGLILLNGFRF